MAQFIEMTRTVNGTDHKMLVNVDQIAVFYPAEAVGPAGETGIMIAFTGGPEDIHFKESYAWLKSRCGRLLS